MSVNSPLRLFEGYGVELEYMLVRQEDLSIAPIADSVLRSLAGALVNEVEVGPASWSNELVLHVLELKNTLPAPELAPLGDIFSEQVRRMNALLDPMDAMLLPTAMHPWMRPEEEAQLWPHEGREIYEAFDRVFDCRRHGWSNLQSAQLNLSFGNDEEFGRLHAAIRLLLPVMAALAASSPIVEGAPTGFLDTRLEVYRTNAARIPSVSGRVIPEPAFGRSDYERLVLDPMYRETDPHDPAGILRHPWLNARGAIAQFARDAIEIRVLDVQETPKADIAICALVRIVLKAMVDESFCDFDRQKSWEIEPLLEIFIGTLRDADECVLRNRSYLELFDFPDKVGTARELWLYLAETVGEDALDSPHLRVVLEHGPLARRILRSLPKTPRREEIATVYRVLARALASGESFLEP